MAERLKEKTPRDARILSPVWLQVPLELHECFKQARLFLCKADRVRVRNRSVLEVSFGDDLSTDKQAVSLVLA